MGKKKEFKKFSNEKTEELKKFLGEKPDDSGVMFLLKKKGLGASFVYGSPRTVHEILHGTSMQDPSFREIVLNVALELQQSKVIDDLNRNVSKDSRAIGVDLSQMDIENMSDEQLDEYFKGISNSKIGFSREDGDE